MIDATQLPRAPSKLGASDASPGTDSIEGGASHINQVNRSTTDTRTQGYPAKELAFVNGRYRAVEQQKLVNQKLSHFSEN